MNEKNPTRREFLKKAATIMTAGAISALGIGNAYTSHLDETDELVNMHLGKKLRISRERVRQIEVEALRKIRRLNSGQTLLNRVF